MTVGEVLNEFGASGEYHATNRMAQEILGLREELKIQDDANDILTKELFTAQKEIIELRKELDEVELAHGKTAIKNQELRATNARLTGALERVIKNTTKKYPDHACFDCIDSDINVKGFRCWYHAISEALSFDASQDLACIRDVIEAPQCVACEINGPVAALRKRFGDLENRGAKV